MTATLYAATVRRVLSRAERAEVTRLRREAAFQAEWIALLKAGEYPVANRQRSIRIARATIRRAAERVAALEGRA